MNFLEDGLRSAINTAFADNPAKRAVALAKLDNPPNGVFDRDDPLFSDSKLLSALRVTPAAVDGLWAQAKELTAG